MSNARKPALYAPMYSVSPATQTLCTPPYSGSYHATGFGLLDVAHVDHLQAAVRAARPARRSAPLADPLPNTSSAMKT